MMMLLGPIYFSIDTAAYEQLQRNTQYQWASQSRLGHSSLKHLGIGGPAYQYIGPGDDSISLNGTIYPKYKGSLWMMPYMRLAASLGIALPLIDVNGFIIGSRWLIENVQETRSALFSNGIPRKVDFSLSLKRYNEDSMIV